MGACKCSCVLFLIFDKKKLFLNLEVFVTFSSIDLRSKNNFTMNLKFPY